MIILPVGDILDIIQGILVNFNGVFFHQVLSFFLASSQSNSLSGFFLTLLNRSMTGFCWTLLVFFAECLFDPGFQLLGQFGIVFDQ